MAPKRGRAEEVEEIQSEAEDVVDEDDVEEEEQTPAKRQQLDMEYKRGTIKKVTVHNFMTYSGTVTIRPGPRLNLVLGPNGTGKSSLVCALCVGLAASTKLLGRAENLGDYVRHGATSAFTEITLSGGGGKHRDIVVRRDIKVDDNRESGQAKRSFNSVCKLDGRIATKEQVLKTITDLNIQFDNLCQFLPQDKVVEFAKMQPKELLEATEKALGEATLYNLHEWLKAEGKKIKLQQTEQKRMQDKLTGLQRQQEAQRRDYERVQQQEQLRIKIDLIGNKLEWLKVLAAKNERDRCIRLLEHAREQWEARQGEVLEDTAPIKKLEKQVSALEQRLQAARQAAKRAKDILHAHHKDVDETKGQLDEEVEKIKTLQEDSDKWKEGIRKLQQEIQELTATLLTMPTSLPPELIDKRKELSRLHIETARSVGDLNEQYTDLTAEIRAIQEEGNPIHRRLQQLGDARFQKLQQWDQIQRGVLSVYQFMIKMKQENRFRGEVLGPVLLEMNMVQGADPSWVDFVEAQCGRVFFNFVTSCREDEKILSDFVKQHHLKLVVNTVNYDYSGAISHPNGQAQGYQSFGISHTLDNVFDAPPMIKHMLKDLTQINRVYIGNADTKRQAPQLFANTPVRDVYCKHPAEGDVKLIYSVSRYNSSAQTTQFDNVHKSRHLGGGSMAQLDAQKEQLQRQLDELKQRLDAKNREQNDVQVQLQRLMAENKGREKELDDIARRQDKITRDRAQLGMQIENKNKNLARQQNQPDPLERQTGIKHRIKKLTASMAELCLEHTAKYQAYWTATRQYIMLECELTERTAQTHALKARVEQQTAELRRLETSKHQAEAVAKDAQSKYLRAKQYAETHAPRTPELTEAMKTLGDDPDALEEQRRELQREADRISVNDANVVAVYEKRQKDIATQQEELHELDERLRVALDKLNSEKAKWLPDLKALVDEINEGFSTNFKEIGCAGEVVLYEPEDNDFELYEIRINVKFRPDEDMQQLTANRQSGGERSVSTILYLIALQGVTSTPFRVVDEINQGMDPINERKVFSLLVESSCKPDTPQCFLLTPKLLPGLPFKHEITLLLIQNGPTIDRPVIDTYDQCAKSGKLLTSLLGERWQPAGHQLAAAQ